MTSSDTLVSVGMPVRNGGTLLIEAIRQVIDQTHRNLEIIISDNCSSDDTETICRDFAARDDRIRYIRHERPLSAIANFKFAFDQARSDYFMWAAHDDRRTLDYVEKLLAALIETPTCVLAFGEVEDFSVYVPFNAARLTDYIFENKGKSFQQRLQRSTMRGAHFYGMHRRSGLKNWYWYDSDYGWDSIMLAYETMQGSFKKVAGPVFYCFRPANHRKIKSPQARAKENSFGSVGKFFQMRRAWHIVKAGVAAEREQGRYHSVIPNFLRLYVPHVWWPHFKRAVVESAPKPVLETWRFLKRTFS